MKTLAMILAGGRVDELGILTYFRPKSTVPFGSLYRFIDFPLSNLMCSGIQRVGILSQYRSSSLIEHIGTGASWDMIGRHRGITLLPPFKAMHASDWYKGTADAVYQNLDFIANHIPDYVLILSGDHVYHMDYNELIKFHEEMEADATIGFVNVPLTGLSRFGLGKIAHDDERGGRLLEYAEKPEKPISTWASMTVYLFNYKILEEVLIENAKEESHEFGRDIIPSLVSSYKVYGYKFKGYWAYCRTIEEYWQANMDLIGEHPRIDLSKWCLRTNLDHEAIRDRAPAIFSSESDGKGGIKNSRIYHGVRVDGYVENSILFPGVHVSEGAQVKNSILFFDTQIGPGTKIERAILDIGVSVGRECEIGKKNGRIVTIGMHTQIPKGTVLDEGCSVQPKMIGSLFKERYYPKDTLVTP